MVLSRKIKYEKIDRKEMASKESDWLDGDGCQAGEADIIQKAFNNILFIPFYSYQLTTNTPTHVIFEHFFCRIWSGN